MKTINATVNTPTGVKVVELFEMFKAYSLGIAVPERKCFFHK